MLDEIKLKKLGGSLKGGVWYIIGILTSKYPLLLDDYKIEIHDVLFYEFKNMVNNTKKFEFKAVTGMLKSYLYLLEDPHLQADQSKNYILIISKSIICLFKSFDQTTRRR